MDVRMTLINQMDGAAAATDVVRMGALARLNWTAVDLEVLRYTAGRVAAVQPQPQLDQQRRIAALQQQLADARSNHMLGQAAIAIGANPRDYMSSGYGAPAPQSDPRLQMFTTINKMLERAAMLRGAPDPEISPALAARAWDLLLYRMSEHEMMQMVLAATPPEQRAEVQLMANMPGVGAYAFAATLRGSAVWAVALADLRTALPDAVLVA